MSNNTLTRRRLSLKNSPLLKAVTIIFCGGLLIGAIEGGYQCSNSSFMGEAREEAMGQVIEEVTGEATDEAAGKTTDEAAGETAEEDAGEATEKKGVLPSCFEAELINVSAFENIHISQDENMIGFWAEESQESVEERLITELQGKGWVRVESGQDGLTTFAREGGEYTWLLLNCASNSGGTSVVVQFC